MQKVSTVPHLPLHYINLTYIGVVTGTSGHRPAKYLEYLVILCLGGSISNKILLLT